MSSNVSQKHLENTDFFLLSFYSHCHQSISYSLPPTPATRVTKILYESITTEKITKDTTNAKLLADLFPDEVKEDVYNNLMMTDIKNEYQMLTIGDIKSITSQVVDQSDINTLQRLNATRFVKNQLRLESLLK